MGIVKHPCGCALALAETWVQFLPPTHFTTLQSQGTLFSLLRAPCVLAPRPLRRESGCEAIRSLEELELEVDRINHLCHETGKELGPSHSHPSHKASSLQGCNLGTAHCSLPLQSRFLVLLGLIIPCPVR